MKDMNTSTAHFEGDWCAVLDFLTGILIKDTVSQVRIDRREKAWKVDVKGLNHAKKRSSNPPAGLYDLYW